MGLCNGAGVAREHVRVAKALRRMPTIAQLFKDGRLSYSKVREVTRVVDVVDEQRLAGVGGHCDRRPISEDDLWIPQR
jgi:hypothetical protein